MLKLSKQLSLFDTVSKDEEKKPGSEPELKPESSGSEVDREPKKVDREEDKESFSPKRVRIVSNSRLDCKYRDGNHCTKMDKNIAVDCRNDDRRCWERMYCDNYMEVE